MEPCQRGVLSAAQKTPLSRYPSAQKVQRSVHRDMLTFHVQLWGQHLHTSLPCLSAGGLELSETCVARRLYLSLWSSYLCCTKGTLQIVQVWDAQTKRCLFSMASHTMAITAVKWGGDERIYTAARDCSINVWDAQVREAQILIVVLLCSTSKFSKAALHLISADLLSIA